MGQYLLESLLIKDFFCYYLRSEIMGHIFRPFATAKSIYDIDLAFYKKMGVKVLFMDLDNTLDSYKLFHPTDKAYVLIENLINAGIRPVIVSNNRGKRVRTYATDLKVEYINSCRKPFPGKIKRFIKNNGLKNEEVMLVGDQMMTDCVAANLAHIRIVLTEKLVKEDQWTTHINRIFGRPIRKHQTKKGRMPDWRTIYGKD